MWALTPLPLLAPSAANLNSINHIFGKAMHKLDPLIKACGSKGKAVQGIQAAAKAGANPRVLLRQEFGVVVNGVQLTVRGVATAFIP
jgi:hypothetical protein